uniref:F5/8 type C domain-containing protein n=1 Tax=Gongylonema pulchrum TaxID=637853 RepID=A0A183CWC3_9BILA
LDGGIVARNIRVIPVSELTRTVCMRVELYGCSYKDQLVSYAIPQGDSLDGLDLQDSSYDGYFNSSRYLVNGLGKLYDGVTGEDNFEKHPEQWIGWRSERHGTTITVEMLFAKKKVINAISFHVSNSLKSGAQVFEEAHVSFSSQGGGSYSPRTLHFNYIPDRNFQTARWVRIPVPSRVAKEIRVELNLPTDADWLLLSEIKFEFANEPLGPEDSDEEELDFSHIQNGDTLTYFAINDTSEDGIRWISIAVVGSLIILFGALMLLLLLLWVYRRTFSRKTRFIMMKKKPKEVQLSVEGPTIKACSFIRCIPGKPKRIMTTSCVFACTRKFI